MLIIVPRDIVFESLAIGNGQDTISRLLKVTITFVFWKHE